MTATADLIAVGFIAGNDGALCAPAGTIVTVAPARDFFVIEIALPSGAVATCTIHQIALKVRERVREREEAQR